MATQPIISVNITVVLCTFNLQQATIHYIFTSGHSYPIVWLMGSSAYKNRTFKNNIVYFSKLLPFVSKRDV